MPRAQRPPANTNTRANRDAQTHGQVGRNTPPEKRRGEIRLLCKFNVDQRVKFLSNTQKSPPDLCLFPALKFQFILGHKSQ